MLLRPITYVLDDQLIFTADLSQCNLVYFDIETTGFWSNKYNTEVIQIAAVCNSNEFNKYIKPTQTIPDKITEITKIHMDNNGIMYYNNIQVHPVSLKLAYKRFLEFIENQSKKDTILIAHNGFRFDFKFIARDLRQCGLLSKFSALVKGCADTAHF